MGNHAFYLLAHGEMDVFVGGTHRRSLGPNDFFGEISMMVLEPATATVVTRTPVRAYVMSHSQFLESFRSPATSWSSRCSSTPTTSGRNESRHRRRGCHR